MITKHFTMKLLIESSFYRARIISGRNFLVQKYYEDWEADQGKISIRESKKHNRGYFDLSDVVIPPVDKAGANRASPKGIPCLPRKTNNSILIWIQLLSSYHLSFHAPSAEIRIADCSIQGIVYPSFQSHVGMNFIIFSRRFGTAGKVR